MLHSPRAPLPTAGAHRPSAQPTVRTAAASSARYSSRPCSRAYASPTASSSSASDQVDSAVLAILASAPGSKRRVSLGAVEAQVKQLEDLARTLGLHVIDSKVSPHHQAHPPPSPQ